MNSQKQTQQCQQCKGKGYYHANLKNLGTKTLESHIVPCDNPTCKNGVVDPVLKQAYYQIWSR